MQQLGATEVDCSNFYLGNAQIPANTRQTSFGNSIVDGKTTLQVRDPINLTT